MTRIRIFGPGLITVDPDSEVEVWDYTAALDLCTGTDENGEPMMLTRWNLYRPAKRS